MRGCDARTCVDLVHRRQVDLLLRVEAGAQRPLVQQREQRSRFDEAQRLGVRQDVERELERHAERQQPVLGRPRLASSPASYTACARGFGGDQPRRDVVGLRACRRTSSAAATPAPCGGAGPASRRCGSAASRTRRSRGAARASAASDTRRSACRAGSGSAPGSSPGRSPRRRTSRRRSGRTSSARSRRRSLRRPATRRAAATSGRSAARRTPRRTRSPPDRGVGNAVSGTSSRSQSAPRPTFSKNMRVPLLHQADHLADHHARLVRRVAGVHHPVQAVQHDARDGVHHRGERADRDHVARGLDRALLGVLARSASAAPDWSSAGRSAAPSGSPSASSLSSAESSA